MLHKMTQKYQQYTWGLAAMVLTAIPQTAYAQVDREMQSLLKRGISWFQGIAMGLCVIAVIRAGLGFLDEEKAPHAWGRMKLTLWGSAIVFSAVGIVQFIKGQFSAQLY